MLGKPIYTAAIHPFVRVAKRDNDTGNSSFDKSVSARPGLTMMRAGLERHIGGSATRRRAGHFQRPGFGMRAPATGGVTTGEQPPISGNNGTADRRVWRRSTLGAARLGNGNTHPSSIIDWR